MSTSLKPEQVGSDSRIQLVQVERVDCPHLSDHEWSALDRMSRTIGTQGVAAMLNTLSHVEQHASISKFMDHELQEAQLRSTELEKQLLATQQRMAAVATAAKPRIAPVKVDVSKYKGLNTESLPRWLVEIDAAILARCIEEPSMQVTFAMSNLAGRAKSWAFGRKMADRDCFPSYESFKRELTETFEPPKTEFRARAEFLDLKQGKRDIHAYSQYTRHLVSCIVCDPIDESTKVVAFMKGLIDGPIKTHLFREYPETLEDAISLAIQEDFSLQQAKVHSAGYRPPRVKDDGPGPMDLSYAEAASSQPPRNKRILKCNRCQKLGHFAYECMAPKPVRHGGRNDRSNSRQFHNRSDASHQSGKAKNGGRQ